MNLAPLLAAPFVSTLHVFAVMTAFFLGGRLIFFSRRAAPGIRA